MSISKLFPICIYNTKLKIDDNKLNDELIHLIERLEIIEELRQRSRHKEKSGFTGDNIQGGSASQLFGLAQLRWLNNEIVHHSKEYLREIAAEPEHYCIHIQKCWPVLITGGEGLNKHRHRNAHLSAVYYPGPFQEDDEQAIIFERNDMHEECFIPVYTRSRNTYPIKPQQGLLIIFPSHLIHYVQGTSKGNSNKRYSLSYDLMITIHYKNKIKGSNEMLVSHPSSWQQS